MIFALLFLAVFVANSVRATPVVDGGWGQWSAVDCTTKECGNGFMHSRRRCDSPAPSNGGKDCVGPPLRSVWCYRKACPSTTPAPTTPPPELTTAAPAEDKCGAVHVKTSRVVGGTDAIPGSWPWQIALYYNGRFFCGGSIINNHWVVTAAHCVNRRVATRYTVVVGDHNRNLKEGNEATYNVEASFVHERYSSWTLNNDIALLKLKSPIKMGKYVQPVCLPEKPPTVGEPCFITGWGKIKHPGSSHSTLQQALLKVVDHQTCYNLNTVKSRSLQVTKQMVCAGHGPGDIRSGCHGDSGGPFVCLGTNGRWVLQGAVSWGSGRCNTNAAYTVFARITEFKAWILKKVSNN